MIYHVITITHWIKCIC